MKKRSHWILFFALTFLAITRVSLVIHEFIGHGLAAKLLGGDVLTYNLYWFAGGWIRYQPSNEWNWVSASIVSSGGMLLELVLGLTALLIARWTRGWTKAVLVLFAALNLTHGAYYAIAGGLHGFGDGATIFLWLESARYVILFGILLPTSFAVFLLAKHIATLFGNLSGFPKKDVAIVFILGLSIHGVLTWTELSFFQEKNYAKIKSLSSARVESKSIKRLRLANPDASVQEIARERRRVRAMHSQFPFRWVVVGSFAAFGLAGFFLSKETSTDNYPPLRWLYYSSFFLGLALLLVALLKYLRPS